MCTKLHVHENLGTRTPRQTHTCIYTLIYMCTYAMLVYTCAVHTHTLVLKSSTCCTETEGYVMTAEPEGSTESQREY